MKKILALFLAAVMCLSLVACGNNDDDDSKGKKDKKQKADVSITGDNANEEVVDEEKEAKYRFIENWVNYPNAAVVDENDKMLFGDSAFPYIYSILKELDGYKDSEEYLSRFNVLPNKLLSISKVTTDAFGQETETIENTFSYTENGERYEEWEMYDFFCRLGIEDTTSNTNIKYQYDDNGVLTDIQFCAYDDLILCKLNLEYDTAGNIIKANFQNRDGDSWTNDFSYDKENRLTETNIVAEIYSGEYERFGYAYNKKYEYDSSGNIIKEIAYYDYEDNFTKTTVYTYDGSKLLTKTTASGEENNSWSRTTTEVYFYDENDNISYAEVYDSDNVLTHILRYNYGNVYFYN